MTTIGPPISGSLQISGFEFVGWRACNVENPVKKFEEQTVPYFDVGEPKLGAGECERARQQTPIGRMLSRHKCVNQA